MQGRKLNEMRVAILVTDDFEQAEMMIALFQEHRVQARRKAAA
jgi:hypothetical protein